VNIVALSALFNYATIIGPSEWMMLGITILFAVIDGVLVFLINNNRIKPERNIIAWLQSIAIILTALYTAFSFIAMFDGQLHYPDDYSLIFLLVFSSAAIIIVSFIYWLSVLIFKKHKKPMS
jgi:NADH:ubiquinone oxidoreductase subunit K